MIRFGIAGFGLHAVKRLMPGFAISRRCTVTALSRRDLQRAKQSAAEFNITHAFASTADLCACPDVDAILVTTPDALHRADVLEAVRHGRPVLCEKPMAMNATEAREMVDAARHAGVLLGVAHVMRFEQSVKWFREQVAQRRFGQPRTARADFLAPLMSSERTWINDPTLATGGPIADVGVHCIDTLRFVLGDEVRAVTARAHYDPRWVVEASAAMVLEFEGGIMATVAVSALSPYQTVLEVAGESGVLWAVNALNVEHPVRLEARAAFDVVETKTVSNERSYADQVDAFAAAIEEGRDFEIPGEEGLKNQLILDAAFRSAKSGKTEAVEHWY